MTREEKKAELAALIKKQVNQCFDEKLSGITIPKGYIRCPDCGKLIPENEKCLYCEQTEIEEEIEEDGDDIDAIDELMRD